MHGNASPPPESEGTGYGGKLGVGSPVASAKISPFLSRIFRKELDKPKGTWPIGRPATSFSNKPLLASVTV